MTNKTRIYNTGKAVTRDELNCLIESAEDSGDWSKVEQANVSEIVDMFNLFNGTKGIENLNLDGWDTSSVTDMCSIFYGSDYNYPLHFDTSSVTDMSYMFSKSKYDHPLDFDTSKVRNMSCMFYESKYNHPILFDTSNVEYMRFMFADSKYNHPLLFDTRNVKNMNGIFDNTSITQPITFKGRGIPDDIQEFIDETNVTYEEKCKLDGVIHNECGNNNDIVVASSFKL